MTDGAFGSGRKKTPKLAYIRMLKLILSRTNQIVLSTVAILLCANAPQIKAASILTIGNSLTFDTVPSSLDGDVDISIFCGQNLKYINENPSAFCVPHSVLWTEVLANKSYDYVTVQPFLGTTLVEDTTIISNWMDMQPTAKFVIHTGWQRSANHAQLYQSPTDGENMSVSPVYFDRLIANLVELHPGQTVTRTFATDILNDISADIDNNIGPYNSLSDLYRDELHMSYEEGRFLMNNVMRIALDQPRVLEHSLVADDRLAYLNEKLAAVPEPSSILAVGLFMVAGLVRSRVGRRRS